MPLGGLTRGQVRPQADTARETSPAASLSWWFGHPTANIHLQLPLLFSAFETKIQFPREVCGVVTRRVLLACFKRRGGAGQGEKFHPRLWPELPFREQAGKMGQSLTQGGSVPHTPPSTTASHPDAKNALMSLPASSQLCKGHLPCAGKHRPFSRRTPFTEAGSGAGEAPLAWL